MKKLLTILLLLPVLLALQTPETRIIQYNAAKEQVVMTSKDFLDAYDAWEVAVLEWKNANNALADAMASYRPPPKGVIDVRVTVAKGRLKKSVEVLYNKTAQLRAATRKLP